MSTFNFTDMFNDASEAGFGPDIKLLVGSYEAVIKAAKSDGTSKKGDPQLGFIFEAVDGSVSDDGEDMSGASKWLNLTFSEAGGKYAAADALKLGITAEMLNTDPAAAVKTVVGQRWAITVVQATNPDFTNIRLGKRIEDTNASTTAAVAAEDGGSEWAI